MKLLFLLTTLLFSTFLMAQNIEKLNKNKHIQNVGIPNSKGFPIWENFEDMLMPPTNWQLQSGLTTETWDTASFDPCWGSGYVQCFYDESLSGVQDEYLISRVIDLRTFSNATLSFYFQFSKYWGINPVNNYDLLVLASTDSAQTFPDTLWTELDSDTSAWESFEWVLAQVDLSAYIGQEKFAVAFVYSGFDGAEAALDIVSIETVGGLDENQLAIGVYPNPANEVLNIQITGSGTLVLADLQGRVVFQKEIDTNAQLDVSALEPGKYLVSVIHKSGIRNISVEIIR